MLVRPLSGKAMSEDHYPHSLKINRFSMNYWVVYITFLSLFIRRMPGCHQGRQIFFFLFSFTKLYVFFYLVLSQNNERDHFSPHTSFSAFKWSDTWSELIVDCWVPSSQLVAIQAMWQALGTPTCFKEKSSHVFLRQWAWHLHACIQYCLVAFTPNEET